MTNKKMTKKDYFNNLLNIAEVKGNPELAKFIENELDLLARKNSSKNGKETPTQKLNKEIAEKILEILTKPMTATDIMKAIQPHFEIEISNQKVSAIMRQLGENGSGLVKKTIDKRKSYFEKV